MKLFWQGTDALFLVDYPKALKGKRLYVHSLRIFTRIAERFINAHQVDHELLKQHLIEFGVKKPIEIRKDNLKYSRLEKIKHDGFNILFHYPINKRPYWNPEFINWLYGYDIHLRLKDELKNKVNWILSSGYMDLSTIYPVVDFLLRPTRHDGSARMVQECRINNIPYYWSQQNPDYEKARLEIEKHLKKQNSEQHK